MADSDLKVLVHAYSGGDEGFNWVFVVLDTGAMTIKSMEFSDDTFPDAAAAIAAGNAVLDERAAAA